MESKKRYNLIYIQNRNRPTGIKSKLMVTKGKGWVQEEFRINIYKYYV